MIDTLVAADTTFTGSKLADWNSPCYSYAEYVSGMFNSYRVCIDGTYTRQFGPGYWQFTWDVSCQTSTTTAPPVSSTTTTAVSTSTTTTAPATVVELSSFTATPASGKIILTWSTESEINNAGFNIYRAAAEGGEFFKISTALIPAKGTSTKGAAYEFIDTDVKNRKTYWYKLEDMDLNGTATMHGPVSATPRLIFGSR